MEGKQFTDRAWTAICALAGSQVRPDADAEAVSAAFAWATARYFEVLTGLDSRPIVVTGVADGVEVDLGRLVRGPEDDIAFVPDEDQ